MKHLAEHDVEIADLLEQVRTTLVGDTDAKTGFLVGVETAMVVVLSSGLRCIAQLETIDARRFARIVTAARNEVQQLAKDRTNGKS